MPKQPSEKLIAAAAIGEDEKFGAEVRLGSRSGARRVEEGDSAAFHVRPRLARPRTADDTRSPPTSSPVPGWMRSSSFS
jgi:hypothetical protein